MGSKCKEFYNRSIKSWLEKKDAIEMYSIHNEGWSVVAESWLKKQKNLKKQNLEIHDFNFKKSLYW